jgi:serine protease Do
MESRHFDRPGRPRFVELTCVLLGMSLAFVGGWSMRSADEKLSATTIPVSDATLPAPNAMPLSSPVSVGAKVRAADKADHNPIARIAAAAVPSVVSIDTTMPLPGCPINGSSGSSVSKRSLRPTEARGAGSGLVVRSDGYVLTNNHVVRNADTIRVTLSDNRSFCGQVVARDNISDLALVKIDAQHLPVARLGHSNSIRAGDYAVAIGTPMGLQHSVTLGIVSAIGRSLNGLNNNFELIQTDAAINPGNSGGPLLNIEGEVIGINMAIRSDAQNIGFAIPVDVARATARKLLRQASAG